MLLCEYPVNKKGWCDFAREDEEMVNSGQVSRVGDLRDIFKKKNGEERTGWWLTKTTFLKTTTTRSQKKKKRRRDEKQEDGEEEDEREKGDDEEEDKKKTCTKSPCASWALWKVSTQQIPWVF